MKKYLIALVLGLVLLLALATTVALADNGPHGGFAANTDACAGCHRIHSASVGSNELLVATSVEALCLSCHGTSGTGAYTNVTDGVYKSGGSEGVGGGSLFAGGFTNTVMATAWSGKLTFDASFNGVSRPTTSKHVKHATGTVWGSGLNNTANGTMILECTSCHDPHGTGGWNVATTPNTRVASYRLLRWQPSGSNGFSAPVASVNWSGGAFPSNDASTPVSGWLVPDNYATNGTEWYTIGSQTINGTGPFALGDYNNGNANVAYQPLNGSSVTQSYVSSAVNVAFFCAQCHDRYFNNSRLRNATDDSVYCGAPVARTVNGVVLTVYPATGTNEHPVDPTNCLANANPATEWDDNRPSGDNVYTYRHSSGDVRLSADGTVAAGAGTSVSRSCVACHVSHGTSAVADPALTNGVDGAAAGVGSLAGGSVLMRMDGRTICLRCHASSVNFSVTLPPTPTITSLDVVSGPIAGGTDVVITGTNFSGPSYFVTAVRFGTSASTVYTLVTVNPLTANGTCRVDSATQITCRTRATAASIVDVRITTTGNQTAVATAAFTFVP
jgi:predicted CXXCH cytochrome family protein